MNKALSAIGWAKQTAKDADVSEPAFYQGVTGGKMVEISVEQKEAEETSGLGAGTGEYRDSVGVGADYGVYMRPKAIGSLLHAILGTVQTTGTGPYTHAITRGDSIPYYKLFGKLDTELRTALNCKLSELSIAWDLNGPVEVNATWVGCIPGWRATAFVPVNDERLAAMFLGVHGVYRYDIDGTTLATAKVKKGKITLKRNVNPDPVSGSLLADDVSESSLKADVELAMRAASFADKRTILTGSPTGETISPDPIYGSFDVAFTKGTDSVTLAGTRVPFNCDDPEADPKGGSPEFTLKGGLYVPEGGTTPITATVVNGLATY